MGTMKVKAPTILTCEDFKKRYDQEIPCCEICHACHLWLVLDPLGGAWELCCHVATRAYVNYRFTPVVTEEIESDPRDSQPWRTAG